MKFFYSIISHIEKFILWFYPPFKRFLPEQTFKYAATGGVNTALDIFLFFVFYNFVLKKEILDLGLFSLSPHIGAFFMSFFFTFPVGFLLARYISFPGSFLRKRVQLFRYGLTVLGSILLNYVFLKLFIEQFGWYATPSKVATTAVVILFSYTAQKYFTFKISD